jgi:hypothetical protein
MVDLLRIAQATDILSIVRAKGRLFALARVGPDATFSLYSIEGWHLLKRNVKNIRRLNTEEILLRTEEGLELFNPQDDAFQNLAFSCIAYDSAFVKKDAVTISATSEMITISRGSECFSLPAPEGICDVYLSPDADRFAIICLSTGLSESPQSHIQVGMLASRKLLSTVVSGCVVEAKWIQRTLFLRLNQDDYLSLISLDGDTLEVNECTEDYIPLEVGAAISGIMPVLGGNKD